MNHVHILRQYVNAGGCVLVRDLDGAPEDVLEGLVVIDEANRFNVALGIFQNRVRGFFHDPNDLWDAAVVDKLIVVSSFLSITG